MIYYGNLRKMGSMCGLTHPIRYYVPDVVKPVVNIVDTYIVQPLVAAATKVVENTVSFISLVQRRNMITPIKAEAMQFIQLL